MDGSAFATPAGGADEASAPWVASPARNAMETDLQFFTRRALEESRLAQRASTPQAAAAHSYLAAAYSSQIAKELAREAELEELLLQLD